MGFLKIGESDRDGRQKRIEHTGRYLRASRTGGVSLWAQTRVSGVNLTANTNHGLRVSTRLAKNTQVAFQNGRFVLRGRYGSDAAKVNLSKSGLTVSSKTPVGTVNWIRPGRSSFKLAGVQLRGHKAAWLQALYGVFSLVFAFVMLVFQVLAVLFQLVMRALGYFVARRQLAAQERDRPRFTVAEVAGAGDRVLAAQGVDPDMEPARDLVAGLACTVVCLGSGDTRGDPVGAGMASPDEAAGHAFRVDVRAVGKRVGEWLPDPGDAEWPLATTGVMFSLAAALARRVDRETLAETLLALDDACLANGPKTLFQEEMIDCLVTALDADVVLAGEG